MRMSESSQNSAARVNLILDQCLQNKAFENGLNLLQNKCAITML